ncbi:NUDIX domain-containing protein [Catellatospora citrea]|uniref:Putative MutT/NUDIX-like protein n=1 Tax=Catellatospora citrea TaxID=53366 RepID=A0A8J3P1Z6_9ACTN|nr:NUDIX domain-containing protein [Catellatospora citrea]RKE06292.1 mutator protein MutT [Catellatospora citrea]GIG01081.1 putative MutT/NUDIX-like protein [Catellatospora citrea]
MSIRRDHYHDPAAPTATRIVPGGVAVIVDEQARVLLQRRADSGNWSLPGGTMEIGETLEQCVVREVREETGLDVEVTGLVGVYTDPGHVIAYGDGEVRQQFSLVFRARVVGGELTLSDESTELRYVAPAEFDALPIHESTRLRLRHHLAGRPTPYLG